MKHGQNLYTEKTFWQPFSFCLLFVMLFLSLIACNPISICITTPANSSCSPAATPTPSATPTPMTAAPSPVPSPTTTPTAPVSPTPTPQTSETPRQEALNSAQHYTSLAMARRFRALYNLLSSDLRNKMDYDQFIHDPDYVLYPDSCWREGDMILSLEKDGQTWDVGVFMTQVTCTGGMTMATYDWHLRILVPSDSSGPPVVIQAGLYPTGN